MSSPQKLPAHKTSSSPHPTPPLTWHGTWFEVFRVLRHPSTLAVRCPRSASVGAHALGAEARRLAVPATSAASMARAPSSGRSTSTPAATHGASTSAVPSLEPSSHTSMCDTPCARWKATHSPR